MELPLRNGETLEVPQDWIDEWNKVYYDVPRTLADMRMWCLDNPAKCKTKRGLRAFMGRWIRKSCIRRPVPVLAVLPTADEERERVGTTLPLETRQAHLAKLRELVK